MMVVTIVALCHFGKLSSADESWRDGEAAATTAILAAGDRVRLHHRGEPEMPCMRQEGPAYHLATTQPCHCFLVVGLHRIFIA